LFVEVSALEMLRIGAGWDGGVDGRVAGGVATFTYGREIATGIDLMFR